MANGTMLAENITDVAAASVTGMSVSDLAGSYLLGIALILVGGILISIIAKKVKLSNILLLIVFGLALGAVPERYPLFAFDGSFLISLGILTLAMIVFDGTSRFKIKDVDAISFLALKLVLAFTIVTMVLLTVFVLFAFGKGDVSWFAAAIYAMVFSIIMVGTDPGSVFVLLQNKKSKVIDLLKVEAIMNTPVMVLLPFLLLDIFATISGSTGSLLDLFVQYLPEILLQIVAGLGTGVVVGFVVIKLMRKFYSEELSPIALMVAALLAYVISDKIGGSGVLAVAALGVWFGNTYVREKSSLQEFSSHLSLSLEILVYVLIGVATFSTIPWGDGGFWLRAVLLYLVLFVCRMISILIVTKGSGEYTPKEKVFMAANMPKGIAVAVVVFTFLASSHDPYLGRLLSLTVVFMIFSLLSASIIDRFGDYFVRFSDEKQKDSANVA
ncbi:MAG: hypothetical protein HC945_01315 [Nitrosarchaeum sp.]|nr:hypothetical protein [Nitrosarchaeum sp.]